MPRKVGSLAKSSGGKAVATPAKAAQREVRKSLRSTATEAMFALQDLKFAKGFKDCQFFLEGKDKHLRWLHDIGMPSGEGHETQRFKDILYIVFSVILFWSIFYFTNNEFNYFIKNTSLIETH